MLPFFADQVTAWLGPLVPFTVAENCWVVPKVTVALPGLTLTDVTVAAGTWRATVAVPPTAVSAALVAVTVSVVPEAGAV
jgi:hypothetical protein